MIFRPILGSSIFGAWVREWGSDSRMTDYKSRVKFDSYHINLNRWYSTTRSPFPKIIMTNYQKMVDDASGLLRTKKSWAGLKAEHVARMKLQNQFKVGLSAKWVFCPWLVGFYQFLLQSVDDTMMLIIPWRLAWMLPSTLPRSWGRIWLTTTMTQRKLMYDYYFEYK